MGLFKKKTKQKTERWFVNCLNEEMTHESLFMCQHWASRPSPSPPFPSVPPNEDKADVIRSNTTAITTYCVHTPICQAISPENHVKKTTKKRGGGVTKKMCCSWFFRPVFSICLSTCHLLKVVWVLISGVRVCQTRCVPARGSRPGPNPEWMLSPGAD